MNSANLHVEVGADVYDVPEHLWNMPPATFSGGERQLIDIARAETIGTNQHGDIVISFKRSLLGYKCGCGPGRKDHPEPERRNITGRKP